MANAYDLDNATDTKDQSSDHMNKPGASGTGLRGINVYDTSATPPMNYGASGTKTDGVDRSQRNQNG